MQVEIIGDAGTTGADRVWINAECELAISTHALQCMSVSVSTLMASCLHFSLRTF